MVLLILALITTASGARTAAQAGDTILSVQYPTDELNLDPWQSATVAETAVLALVYEGLTRIDANQETVPAAAESWAYNEDATQITFTLRPGLTYSDGSPLTAENFRYAGERTCSPASAGPYQSLLFAVAGCAEMANLGSDESGDARDWSDEEYDAAKAGLGVRALDARTLQIDLDEPAAYFHTVASTWLFAPVKEEIVAADPEGWWRTAAKHVGNGPFTFTEIADGVRYTFAANDAYWQGRPKLDGITYVAMDDPGVALAAYRAGTLDIIRLNLDTLADIEADPELAPHVLSHPQAATYYLAMSLVKPPFDDPKVREAFALAFDREAWCAELMGGLCQPALTWIPPGIPGAVESAVLAFDPEAARAALAASSYGNAANLPPIALAFSGDPLQPEEVPNDLAWAAARFRDVLGVDIVFEAVEDGEFMARLQDPATFPQMVLNGWFQDYPDPHNWLSLVWRCDSAFAQAAGYCNAEFDRLTAVGDTTTDTVARRAAYEAAHRLLIGDVPGVFTDHPADVFLVSPAVAGLTPSPGDTVWPGSHSSLMSIDKTD